MAEQSATSKSNTTVRLRDGGWWVLAATMTGSAMVSINSSALNVALDAIQREFNTSGTGLVWVVNVYLLALAAFLLIGGALGDRFGRNRIFAIGGVIFTVASIACALAPNIGLLIAARAAQGFGGALLLPGSLAIITATIRASDRSRAIGYWSVASALSTILGPVLGGFLAQADLWRWIFLISLPLALIIAFALRKVPETKDENAPRQLDYLGASVLALSLMIVTFGALQLGEVSRLNTRALVAIGLIIVGIALMFAFVWIERRSDHPMVNLDLFKSQNFSAANVMTAFIYAGLGGLLVFLPLNLIQIQGYAESAAGFATLPVSLLLAILSPMMGWLLGKVGPRLLLTVGPAVAGIGFFLLGLPGVTEGAQDYWTTFFPGLIGVGLGIGIMVAPLTTTVMSSVSESASGTASGINNAVTRTAQSLATGILGAVLLFVFSTALLQRTDDLELPEQTRTSLEQEANKLGNTPVPQGLAGETESAVETAINRAFVDAFRMIAMTAAALAWISAGMSMLLIDPGKINLDDEAS